MFSLLHGRVLEALEDQEQQDFRGVHQWLQEYAGLVVRRNINQPWVSKHIEMQLSNHLVVFQTLADFAFVLMHSSDQLQRETIKNGLDALLTQYTLQDHRLFYSSDTEPSDPTETDTATETDATETTQTTQTTQTTATQNFDQLCYASPGGLSLHSSQRHSRNGYLYTFA